MARNEQLDGLRREVRSLSSQVMKNMWDARRNAGTEDLGLNIRYVERKGELAYVEGRGRDASHYADVVVDLEDRRGMRGVGFSVATLLRDLDITRG